METVVSPNNGVILYLSLGHAGFAVNAEVDGFLAVAKESGLVSVAPTDAEWPFARFHKHLDDVILQSILDPSERAVIDGTGGLRVLVLRRRLKNKKY
jgi:hypothetical protein